MKKQSAATNDENTQDLATTWSYFEQEGREFWTEMDSLVEVLDGVIADEASDA